jgi:hypothetical protein
VNCSSGRYFSCALNLCNRSNCHTVGRFLYDAASRRPGLIRAYAVPTMPETLAGAVASLYAPHDPAGKGRAEWTNDLQNGSGPAFEVALLNALARMEIPTLFAGQFKGPEGESGGTATPGIDLVALDARNLRAVAISAKGAPKLPKHEQLEVVRQAVHTVGRALPGWSVFGLVACHAPPRDFATWTRPDDIKVWGQAEVERFLQASTVQAIAGLLWMPPWTPEAERWRYAFPASSAGHGRRSQRSQRRRHTCPPPGTRANIIPPPAQRRVYVFSGAANTS